MLAFVVYYFCELIATVFVSVAIWVHQLSLSGESDAAVQRRNIFHRVFSLFNAIVISDVRGLTERRVWQQKRLHNASQVSLLSVQHHLRCGRAPAVFEDFSLRSYHAGHRT